MPQARRLQSTLQIRHRIDSPDQLSGDGECAMLGCSRPTSLALSKGLSRLHCKYHLQHKARHGSTWRKTLTALELQPFRKAAKTWLKAHSTNPMVLRAVAEIDSLVASSGPWEPAYSLKGKKPKERARVALARLRRAKVSPERILESYLAVTAALQVVQPADNSETFRTVQIAKPLHRMASGFHIPNVKLSKGSPLKVHFYPETRGLILVHLGKMIGEACQTGIARYDILEVVELART